VERKLRSVQELTEDESAKFFPVDDVVAEDDKAEENLL
jgi:hypothetical protein